MTKTTVKLPVREASHLLDKLQFNDVGGLLTVIYPADDAAARQVSKMFPDTVMYLGEGASEEHLQAGETSPSPYAEFLYGRHVARWEIETWEEVDYYDLKVDDVIRYEFLSSCGKDSHIKMMSTVTDTSNPRMAVVLNDGDNLCRTTTASQNTTTLLVGNANKTFRVVTPLKRKVTTHVN